MVRDYFEEHQTEYMFTPIFLPDCDYSISLPYETKNTIPSIYLSILERQSKITSPEITIGFFDPDKYPNEYSETLGCFVTEGTCAYIKENEFENIQEKLYNTNKPEKFYLLDEDKYNSIKEFCKYSCIMSNSECCKSCQIKNILQ
jgi:hypothetical protein